MTIRAAYAVPHPPLIIPTVGRGEEAGVQDTVHAYEHIARQICEIEPELIVITSPHATLYRDWFHVSPGTSAQGDMHQFGAFETGLTVAYDSEFTGLLNDTCAELGFPAGAMGERDSRLDHATYVPLWFIEQAYREAGKERNYQIARIGLSGFDALMHYRLGQIIATCVNELDRRCVFLASGDLSHKLTEDGPYGYAVEGPEFDAQITAAFAKGDFLKLLAFDSVFADRAAECGLRSFQIMAGALDGLAIDAKLLSYEGPFGVGYGIASFVPRTANDGLLLEDAARCFADAYRAAECDKVAYARTREDAYVALARRSVETFVRTGKELKLDAETKASLPAEMLEQRAGTFVSLHTFGQLRGCIGTIAPTGESIAEEIIYNGVQAASKDPRFDPVSADELDVLAISVDVLGPTEAVSGPEFLDAKRYGVVVTSGWKRGLLLPNLDGVDTVEEQISIAKSKAGIAGDEAYTLERFEVVRHE